MRITVFIICICLLLSRGVNDIYITVSHHGGSYQHSQQLSKKQPLTFANNNHPYVIPVVNGLNAGEELLINEEEEDEETHKALARKCRSIDSDNLISSYLIHTDNRHFCCNAPKPYYSLQSNKYISQRVLRIWCHATHVWSGDPYLLKIYTTIFICITIRSHSNDQYLFSQVIPTSRNSFA